MIFSEKTSAVDVEGLKMSQVRIFKSVKVILLCMIFFLNIY